MIGGQHLRVEGRHLDARAAHAAYYPFGQLPRRHLRAIPEVPHADVGNLALPEEPVDLGALPLRCLDDQGLAHAPIAPKPRWTQRPSKAG